MIVNVNDNNFVEYLSKGLKIVEVFAPWCGYCAKQRAEIDSMKDIEIGVLNSEASPALMQKLNITAFPTMVVFKNGKELNRFLGLKTKFEIMDIITRYLNK